MRLFLLCILGLILIATIVLPPLIGFRGPKARNTVAEFLRYGVATIAVLCLLTTMISALIPVMFFFSEVGTAPYLFLQTVTLGLVDWLGDTTIAHVLCPFAREAACPSGAITLQNTLTEFQALFGFAFATGILVQLTRAATRALKALERKLDAKFKTFRPDLFGPEDKRLAQGARTRWQPRFMIIVRWTFNTALANFYLTSAVAALAMGETFILADFELRVSKSLSVAFAIAPFLCVFLLFLHYVLCNSVIERGIAPGFYYRRARAKDVSRVVDQILSDAEAAAGPSHTAPHL
jgi:hypothetical protein